MKQLTLKEYAEKGVRQFKIENGEAIAVNPYVFKVQENSKTKWENQRHMDVFNLPPIPAPNIEPGLYEIERFEPKDEYYSENANQWLWTDNIHIYKEDYATRTVLVLKEQVEETLQTKLNDNEVEYRSQIHEMWVEGTADNKPTHEAIINHAKSKGYSVTNIGIWHDDLQGFWRFNGDIKPISEQVEEKPEGESFLDYIKTERADFTRSMNRTDNDSFLVWDKLPTNVRVAIEDILIAYDQMTERLTPQQPEAEPVERTAEEIDPIRVLNAFCFVDSEDMVKSHVVAVASAMEEYANLKVKEALANR